MAETSIFLAGNLTSDPELHHSSNGTARATFRVAVSSRVRDGEGWRDGEPAFYAVVAWRDQAVHGAESLAKGSRVVVVGRLVQRSWQAEDGTSRSVADMVADELGPSLRWATATTTRTTRSSDRLRAPSVDATSGTRSMGSGSCLVVDTTCAQVASAGWLPGGDTAAT
jgi:single-strand DNA-binding protein